MRARRWTIYGMMVTSVAIAIGCMSGPDTTSKEEDKSTTRWWQAKGTKKPTPGVTRDNYERVKRGMTQKQVIEILGEGKEDGRSQDLVVMTWQNDNMFKPVVITIMFADGRVDTKAISD